MQIIPRWLISLLCVGVLAATMAGCQANHNQPSNESNSTTATQFTTTTTVPTTTTITVSTTTTSTAATTITTTYTTAATTVTTACRQTTSTTHTTFSPHSNTQTKFDSHLITAPLIAQTPNYPSGCESVSAVMLLNYWGESITVDTFIDDYLPKSTNYYTKNGVFYGPSPYEYFIGNPRTTNAYGCMAPAIKKAIDQYYGTDSPAKNVTGYTLKELCSQFINNDQPVLVWVTIGMVETQPGDSWHFEDGTLFSWPVNEHCMMLVGYDKNYYYFNDPYTGKLKKYAHWICEDRYNTLGQQALTIIK